MKRLIAALTTGAFGFSAACILVSGWSVAGIWLFPAGALIALLSLGITRLIGRTSLHSGAFTLSATLFCLALFGLLCLATGADMTDATAWAAIGFYGLATGLLGSIGARLVNTLDRPRFDYMPLTLAVAGVCGLAAWGWQHPIAMLPASHVVHVVTEEQFKVEVESSDVPVVVDFGASWCGPCRQLAPNLDKLAGELKGKVKFVSVDVDQLRSIRKRYDFQGIPALLVFKNGSEVQELRRSGYMTVDELRAVYGPLAK